MTAVLILRIANTVSQLLVNLNSSEMVVRICLQYGQGLRKTVNRQRQFALILATLLTPGSVMAGVLGAWRIGADLNWMGEFAVSKGIFSHWQVWFALAGAMQVSAIGLLRYARATEVRDKQSIPVETI